MAWDITSGATATGVTAIDASRGLICLTPSGSPTGILEGSVTSGGAYFPLRVTGQNSNVIVPVNTLLAVAPPIAPFVRINFSPASITLINSVTFWQPRVR